MSIAIGVGGTIVGGRRSLDFDPTRSFLQQFLLVLDDDKDKGGLGDLLVGDVDNGGLSGGSDIGEGHLNITIDRGHGLGD